MFHSESPTSCGIHDKALSFQLLSELNHWTSPGSNIHELKLLLIPNISEKEINSHFFVMIIPEITFPFVPDLRILKFLPKWVSLELKKAETGMSIINSGSTAGNGIPN